MNGQPWPLRWFGPLLIAATPVTAAPATGSGEPPSIELLEYLAEFELDDDGRLLDPLEEQRNSRDDDPPRATTPSSTPRSTPR